MNMNPNVSASDQANLLRQSAADYFFVLCRQVLPRIEEKIELQLLEKFKSTMKNPAEKRELH